MPQDAFTLYHQAKELNKMLAGGKVNRITQPAESEVYFGVYANGARCKLAVSANVATAPEMPRRSKRSHQSGTSSASISTKSGVVCGENSSGKSA